MVKTCLNKELERLTEEQIEEFREAFFVFDTDGSGTISTEYLVFLGNFRELGSVIRSLGQRPSEEELEEIMATADEDGNGEVDFPEFLGLMAKKMATGDPDKEIKDAWAVFSEGNEFIRKERIKLIMENLGEELDEEGVNRLVEEADYDGDGEINYDDFYKTMKNLPKTN
eukprot:maker-scaffold_8-snap-gene-6.7-mRNA-1 protein AED:0.43 eAED:0.43 QI:0/0/0/0.5/1/1/2/0/169